MARNRSHQTPPSTFKSQHNTVTPDGISMEPARKKTKMEDEGRRTAKIYQREGSCRTGEKRGDKMSHSPQQTGKRKAWRAKDGRRRSGKVLRKHATPPNRSNPIGSNTIRGGRNTVDAETMQYFMEISALIREGGFVIDPEERSTLCSNVLEETHGKELQLACNGSCSRVLEILLPYCDISQISSFLHRSSSVFASIALDASGSHVAEAALKSAAAAIHNCDTEQAWYGTMKQVISKICEDIADRAVDVMCSCYGSHALRSLLSLCSGILLETSSNSKLGRNVSGLAGRLFRLTSNTHVSPGKSKGHAFPDLLEFLVNKLLEAVKKSSVQLQMDPFAGPVLQTILKALEGNAEAVTKAIAFFLGCANDCSGNDGNVLESVSKGRVMQLVFDSKSSHLMEVMLELAPDALFVELLQRFFRHSLLELSLHQSANFVVQALIASVRHQDQVIMIFKELENSFLVLIKERRAGVIASLLAACGRFGTNQQEACRLLACAIMPRSRALTCLVPRILFLEAYARAEDSETWKPVFHGKMSVLGCAMLEVIFSYPKGCNQQFCSSLAALETNDFLEMAKDERGSHAIESFLTSTSVPRKHKQRVISRLKGNFAGLAANTISSFTVDKCFSVANIVLKEAITSELASVQAELSKTKHGPYLLKKCDVMGFLKSCEQWRMRITSKNEVLKSFSEIFHPEGDDFKMEDQLNRLAPYTK